MRHTPSPAPGRCTSTSASEKRAEEEIRLTVDAAPNGMLMIDPDGKVSPGEQPDRAGDVVLREVAQLMKSKMRGGDVVCRHGGEEFAIISPEMTLEVARQKMDYLREELKKLAIRYQEQRLDTPTISIGLSAFPIHGADGEALLKSADEALYRAKKTARDRVVIADDSAVLNTSEAAVH